MLFSDNNTIKWNTIYNSSTGIFLNESDNNIVKYNILLDNIEGLVVDPSCSGNIIDPNTIQNRGSGNGGGDIPDVPPGTPPTEFPIIIVIIVIIIGAVASVAFVAVKKKGKPAKPDKIDGISEKYKEEITPAAIPPKRDIKPKKARTEVAAPIGLTAAEMMEQEKTEAEVGVEKQQFICVVHKGAIKGAMYNCPECQTLYCLKCATALKDKGEKCWSCETEIKL